MLRPSTIALLLGDGVDIKGLTDGLVGQQRAVSGSAVTDAVMHELVPDRG